MERLVSSGEAAQILGLSLQGVHYRIKNGKLKSQKKDGKTFVFLDDTLISGANKTYDLKNIDSLLEVKDEQILFLNNSIRWMRKQYKNEIKRIERNQDKMVKVFQSEINLLQSAFNEMRTVYKITKKDEPVETSSFSMMDIKDFFIFMKKSNKSDTEIKSIILERIKQGDKRFIFNRESKEVMIYKSDFVDLI